MEPEKVKYDEVSLVIYNYIDGFVNRRGEEFNLQLFLEFETYLQMSILNQDVLTIRKHFNITSETEKGRDFEYITSTLAKTVVEELRKSIPKNELKQKCFDLLYSGRLENDKTYKPKDKKGENGEEVEDESGIGISREDEAKIAEKPTFGEDDPIVSIDDNRFDVSSLTPIELACFKYLSDPQYNEPILNIFTYKGIIQMANNASIKLYLNNF